MKLPQASNFEEHCFREKVDDALKAVERILEIHRNPRLAEDVDHVYRDKYRLVDQMTNTALIGQLNTLVHFGLTSEVIKSIDTSKPTTLRFQASDSCTFLKEQIVEVPTDKTEEIDEQSQTSGSFFGSTMKSTIKQVVNHVKEYHWKVEVKWEISIYSGTNVDEKKVLQTRTSSTVVIIQSNKRAPLPDNRESKPLDLSLTWLMSQIDTNTMASKFCVDTQDLETKTPRRNRQVDEAFSFMINLETWTRGVRSYFHRCVQQDIIDKHNPAGPIPIPNVNDRLTSLNCEGIFVPVQMLMEEASDGVQMSEALAKSVVTLPLDTKDDITDSSAKSPVLSSNDMHKLLNEQIRSVQERIETLQKSYPARQLNKVVTVAEASVVVLSLYSERLGHVFEGAVEYVEGMLSNQLEAAIGKRVTSSDIDQFVRYHNARLLNPPPQPFCHAIRQTGHYPCGLLSIEGTHDGMKMEPIETLSREVESSTPIGLPLNAATTVELTGKKYLHGWIQQRFGGERQTFDLIARARQFSSFLLVVGTMAGPDKLNPKDAIIVQNKDELLIPLILDEIPTTKEFKNAIQSLSPEQQRFAQAFRSLQLGSSVMGISVIQIKPQLETLLGLPHDALTKEMKLTQDLMELFVEYQVPSDLLSYDGTEANASPKEKVENVREHVKAVSDVIDEAKTKQLKEQTRRADMALDLPGNLRCIPYEASSNANHERDGPFDLPGNLRCVPRMSNIADLESDFPPFDRPGNLGCVPRMSNIADLESDMELEFDSDPFDRPGDVRGVPRMSNMADSAPTSTPARQSNRPSSYTSTLPQQHVPTSVKLSEKRGDFDFTTVPKILNCAIEEHSGGAALRSTTVKLADEWRRNRLENLLSKPKETLLHAAREIKTERNKAYDLLDALSRSGSLSIACSELHVIVSVTHCFQKDVIETVIQENVNPVEKLELSTLLVGAAIHGVPAHRLIRDDRELLRLKGSFPVLLSDEANEE